MAAEEKKGLQPQRSENTGEQKTSSGAVDYSEGSFNPSLNCYEEGNKYIVELFAPGFSKENFSIHIFNNLLEITGSRSREVSELNRIYLNKEYNAGKFTKKFKLPENVNNELVRARYNNGILKITLPKE